MKRYKNTKVNLVLFLLMVMLIGCSKDSTLENTDSSSPVEEASDIIETAVIESEDNFIEIENKKESEELAASLEESNKKYKSINSDIKQIEKKIVKDYFLESKGIGNCDVLTGEVLVKVVLVDDALSQWNEQDVEGFKNTMESGTKRLTGEAERYGANVNIELEYIPCKIDVSIQESDDWYGKVYSAANLEGEELTAKDKKKPLVLALNQDGRSGAYPLSYPEYLILYSEYDVENSYIHELLHLFGAEDFYYHEGMSKLADRYLPQSIMNTPSLNDDLVVDDFTAYLVGWSDEVSEETKAFLAEVDKIPEIELNRSKANDARGGNVIDYEIYGGLYTGELLNGMPHGYGKLVWDYGDMYQDYEGEWRNGMYHGHGKETLINKSSQTHMVREGIWEIGELIEAN